MPRITEMYAYIVCDQGPDDEGLAGFYSAGVWMAMVGADTARADQLRPLAQQLADASGRTLRLVRFVVREECAVIEPQPVEEGA